MNRKIVIANWKMNKTIKEAISFLKDIKDDVEKISSDDVMIAIAPSYLTLPIVDKVSSNIYCFAQNVHHELKGSYTGEVSIEMLKEITIPYVIVGHSERRKYFNETDQIINKKLKLLSSNNMSGVFCFGEELSDYEQGNSFNKIKEQIEVGLSELSKSFIESLIFAYEPVYAIGTNKASDPSEVSQIVTKIRDYIKEEYQIEDISVVYGGSVNSNNVTSYTDLEQIDGVLVGNASLDSKEFIKLIKKVVK